MSHADCALGHWHIGGHGTLRTPEHTEGPPICRRRTRGGRPPSPPPIGQNRGRSPVPDSRRGFRALVAATGLSAFQFCSSIGAASGEFSFGTKLA